MQLDMFEWRLKKDIDEGYYDTDDYFVLQAYRDAVWVYYKDRKETKQCLVTEIEDDS